MKKTLLILAILAVVAFVSVQSSEAYDVTIFPNGNVTFYYNAYELNSYGDHAVVNVNNDGTATGAILDYEGYVQMDLYLSPGGVLYYSTDGIYFYRY